MRPAACRLAAIDYHGVARGISPDSRHPIRIVLGLAAPREVDPARPYRRRRTVRRRRSRVSTRRRCRFDRAPVTTRERYRYGNRRARRSRRKSRSRRAHDGCRREQSVTWGERWRGAWRSTSGRGASRGGGTGRSRARLWPQHSGDRELLAQAVEERPEPARQGLLPPRGEGAPGGLELVPASQGPVDQGIRCGCGCGGSAPPAGGARAADAAGGPGRGRRPVAWRPRRGRGSRRGPAPAGPRLGSRGRRRAAWRPWPPLPRPPAAPAGVVAVLLPQPTALSGGEDRHTPSRASAAPPLPNVETSGTPARVQAATRLRGVLDLKA